MNRSDRSRRDGDDVPAPRWRCCVRPCYLGGRWQSAGSNREANQRAHGHYVTEHWKPAQ